jgi:hypothetical protein
MGKVTPPPLPVFGVKYLDSIAYGGWRSAKYSFQILYGQSLVFKRVMGLNGKSPGDHRGFL